MLVDGVLVTHLIGENMSKRVKTKHVSVKAHGVQLFIEITL